MKNASAPELLAPAGDWDCLRAAVANGADAVYFGLPKFNARLRAENFQEEELPEIMAFLHGHGAKGFIAFNTLVFTDELEAAAKQLQWIDACGVDAVIVQDLGLAWLAEQITPDLHVHASTQMTITSPEGMQFARQLGVKRVVLARELSLQDLAKFPKGENALPIEVFVHGALCVAYSGQCLTSESLGQRSANRGECAQACRMPYELIVDGKQEPLGDRRYLLSPQDLAAVDQVPKLIELGIESFKIEGRLKTPEYVAAVTQVYRRAIDQAMEGKPGEASEEERYQLEMTFSRGLYSGWMHGVNHQELVPARFGKKRGAYVGRVSRVGDTWVECEIETLIAPGDGIVFDTGGDTDQEQGGRVYEMRGSRLFFEHRKIDFRRVSQGDRIWKTDDPDLNRRLRKSFAGRIEPRRHDISMRLAGCAGSPLLLEASDGTRQVKVSSSIPLQAARNCPLTEERLRDSLGRLGDTPFRLGGLRNEIAGDVIIPVGELNRMRREAVDLLLEEKPRRSVQAELSSFLPPVVSLPDSGLHLHVLCRTPEQIEAALESGICSIYADFEDVRRYRDAVALVRSYQSAEIAVATPRIQKASEQGFFKLIENCEPHAVLVRNLGGIEYFRSAGMRMIGDFSLNVANPLTAQVLMKQGLERLTISYDLNAGQMLELLLQAPPAWFELTIHQHMPMFHMEHCVFAAFLSKGTDHTNCGRPCEKHDVRLRDRVGMEHPLKADVGCRNTVYNSLAQTGSQFFAAFMEAGLRSYRVELLLQEPAECRRILELYQSLLGGRKDGADLWKELQARAQLGVTRGTYAFPV